MPAKHAQAIYNLTQLHKQYQDRAVLQINQLDIYAAEILAIVGPSGAGKSTLLRLLNFLEPPTSGQIRFKSENWVGESPPVAVRRKITTVFQQPVLLNRSVRDNVAYGLNMRGVSRTIGQAKVQQALSQVGLAELAHASAKTLSGGEAQRVALARALVFEPDVLLLDEPTASLDPYNVRLIEQILAQVNQQQDTTIILVTHNIFQAKRVAHRTAFLLDGHLIEVADTISFFEQPTDPRTAAFVRGEMVY